MNYNEAVRIKENVIDRISHSIPKDVVNELFSVYNTEVRPNRFREQPCACDRRLWIEMVSDTKAFVTRIIEAWEAEPTKKKKGKA